MSTRFDGPFTIVGIFLLVATLFAHGCAVELISEQSVENKLAKVQLGVTTKAEIENLFGNEHGAENLRWVYNLSDTALEISGQKTGMVRGFSIPVAMTPTKTQALITVTLEKQTLHITSTNPHDQVTNEYRVFTKRESAFIDKISALTAETIVSPPAAPQQASPPVMERQ